MAFNPNLPADGALIAAPELRSQFTALHSLIAAQGADIASLLALVQGQGSQITSLQDALNTAQGDISTLQGEVAAVGANAANNPVGIAQLGGSVSDPPTQGEVTDVVSKVNEMLTVMSHA